MGRPKLTLPFGKTTVLGATVNALRDGGVTRVYVVARPDDDEITASAATHGCRIAINLHPERGMLSSVIAGLEEIGGTETLKSGSQTLLVTPGDLPQLQAGTVSAILRALEPDGYDLAVPRFRNRSGHPLAIAPDLIDRIPSLDPSIGLRQLKQLVGDRLKYVDCDDPGCIDDVDSPRDYYRALS